MTFGVGGISYRPENGVLILRQTDQYIGTEVHQEPNPVLQSRYLREHVTVERTQDLPQIGL